MISKRNLGLMTLYILLTGGIYIAYWFVKTKRELNQEGAAIPTGLLFFIPFANIYFIYLFAQAFTQKVLHDENKTIIYFVLLFLIMPVGVLVAQNRINRL